MGYRFCVILSSEVSTSDNNCIRVSCKICNELTHNPLTLKKKRNRIKSGFYIKTYMLAILTGHLFLILYITVLNVFFVAYFKWFHIIQIFYAY